jgi:crotonobetainyl-CoA hydratase
MLAADTAEFALPEVKLGMMADSGGVLRLPKRLPRAIAAELLLTGRRMGAAEAQRWGLVNRVVPLAQLAGAAQELARELVAAAPLALAAVKQVLRATEAVPVEDGYRVLRGDGLPAYRAMLSSADAQEGPQAFADKRPPVWRNA